MTISTFREHHDDIHGRGRVLFELSRVQVWLSVLGLLGGFVVSAATGVVATAHVVVPPIAQMSLKPELDRLVATDIRLEASIAKVERDDAARTADNTRALREQMDELQQQLRETSRVTNELLLQLAQERRR
jgi:uncharacterized lipoprotein YajG